MHPLTHLRSLPRPPYASDVVTYRVPHSREDTLPDLGCTHRYIVRTFIDVPADAHG